ncbi:hypothetical protein CVS28_03910 [Arthrobacter glacialis]|nr:hypothetical protein CVS28_03910 [Arthrobacter glacialis]
MFGYAHRSVSAVRMSKVMVGYAHRQLPAGRSFDTGATAGLSSAHEQSDGLAMRIASSQRGAALTLALRLVSAVRMCKVIVRSQQCAWAETLAQIYGIVQQCLA